MNTSRRIEGLLQEIQSLIGDDKESIDWFNKVRVNASTFKTDEEEIAYLEDILIKLQNSDDEEIEDADEAQEPKKGSIKPLANNLAVFRLSYYSYRNCCYIFEFLIFFKKGRFESKPKLSNHFTKNISSKRRV